MHELSIALSILDVAAEEAARHDNARVTAIHLKLGVLSGVVKEALASAFDLACADSSLEGCSLVIEEVPATVYCRTCAAERTVLSIQELFCSVCGTPTSEVLRGREMEVVALEIES